MLSQGDPVDSVAHRVLREVSDSGLPHLLVVVIMSQADCGALLATNLQSDTGQPLVTYHGPRDPVRLMGYPIVVADRIDGVHVGVTCVS